MCPAQVYEVGRAGRGQGRGRRHAVELRPVRRDHRQGRAADACRGRRGPRVFADVITRDDVLAAREAIGGRLHRTPLFSSRRSLRADRRRAHFSRPSSSSAPARSSRAACSRSSRRLTADEKARGIVTWSAGNAGQGAAFAARELGVACRVFMWRTANPLKVQAHCRGTVPRSTWNRRGPADAHTDCSRSSRKTGATFVHPFDDPVLQAGYGAHRSLEIVEDVPGDDHDRRARSRGGGLIAGIASAVGCRVVGVEPELSPTMARGARGRAAGRRSSRARSPTGSARRSRASTRCRSCATASPKSCSCRRTEIKEAMRFLYARAKLACEPAGAASTAALLAGKVVDRTGIDDGRRRRVRRQRGPEGRCCYPR